MLYLCQIMQHALLHAIIYKSFLYKKSMKTRKEYEAPTLTVVSFKTERGYTVSVWIGNEDDSPDTGVSDYTVENEGNFYEW